MPTRDQILDAAEQVLRARGVGGTTTKEIARAARCAEGSLYNHFADKRELLLSVLTERMPTFVAYVEALPERAGTRSVRANLEELAGLAVPFYRELVPMLATTLADPQLLRQHRAALRRSGEGPQRPVAAVSAYLTAEQRLGRVRRRADPLAAASLLLGACFQQAAMAVGVGEDALPLPLERFARETVRTLIAGLEPPKDS